MIKIKSVNIIWATVMIMSVLAIAPVTVSAGSPFEHEAFTIYSPLISGTYDVNEKMLISVKREKWIAKYRNGHLINDYNYIFLEISKGNSVKKSMKICIYPPSKLSHIKTYTDSFTPTETGEYKVRVGFATPDMSHEDCDKITNVNYVDSYKFKVINKTNKQNSNEDNNNYNLQKQINYKKNILTDANSKVKTIKAPKSIKKSKKLIISVTLNKKIKDKLVSLIFHGKTYKTKTNNKGVATIIIKKSVIKKLGGKKVKYRIIYNNQKFNKTIKVKK